MIDEKKIQEAAIMNADYFNPCRSTLDREEACRASFEDGVEWFKENILPDDVEITHDDNNYFEVCVEGKSYSCNIYGDGDFYHNVADFNLLEDNL